jgi:5-methyltetrahydropteroyltriglutamate--homocysteine methyltransferase
VNTVWARFAACLHDCVADAVREQAEIGLDIVNDGEYGKTISWSRYVLQRMSGFEQRDRPGHAGMPAAVAGRDRHDNTNNDVSTSGQSFHRRRH